MDAGIRLEIPEQAFHEAIVGQITNLHVDLFAGNGFEGGCAIYQIGRFDQRFGTGFAGDIPTKVVINRQNLPAACCKVHCRWPAKITVAA